MGRKKDRFIKEKIKFLQEGFRAIKDIKILQRSKELIKNFLENNSVINQSEFKNQFVDSSKIMAGMVSGPRFCNVNFIDVI